MVVGSIALNLPGIKNEQRSSPRDQDKTGKNNLNSVIMISPANETQSATAKIGYIPSDSHS